MIKINSKYLTLLICIMTLSYISSTGYSHTDNEQDVFVYGKVVYADDNSPVPAGKIRVFNANNSVRSGSTIEIANILSNGVFKILRQSIETTDEIKIMAYPNDVDNSEIPFEPLTLDASTVVNNTDKEYEISIAVQRVKENKAFKNESMLKQNFPNPFNPTTLISFELPEVSRVSLKIYNTSGVNVATLIDNEVFGSGLKEVVFNANALPSGIYLYSLTAGNFTVNKKMILLK